MSIRILLFLTLAAATDAWCVWNCPEQKEAPGIVDGAGVTIENVRNATVLVGVLKDLEDHHSTRFTNLEVSVGALLVIVAAGVTIWLGRRLWLCGINTREAYVSRRFQSMVRRYNQDPPPLTPALLTPPPLTTPAQTITPRQTTPV